MTCVQCIVKPAANSWVAEIGDKELGPYLTRDMALRVAIADALACRKAGRPAQIIVKDADGAVCAGRCLCAGFDR